MPEQSNKESKTNFNDNRKNFNCEFTFYSLNLINIF